MSNKADIFTRKMVSTLFPNRDFKLVVGVINEADKKTNTVGALMISNKLNLLPKEVICVGDSGIDMQTAINAGMYGI